MTLYYTAEVMEEDGEWHRCERYPDPYFSESQAVFAIGRQEHYDELENNPRKYKVGTYEDRRHHSSSGSFSPNQHKHIE